MSLLIAIQTQRSIPSHFHSLSCLSSHQLDPTSPALHHRRTFPHRGTAAWLPPQHHHVKYVVCPLQKRTHCDVSLLSVVVSKYERTDWKPVYIFAVRVTPAYDGAKISQRAKSLKSKLSRLRKGDLWSGVFPSSFLPVNLVVSFLTVVVVKVDALL